MGLNEKYVEGLKGEKIIRDFLKKKKIHFLQADLIAKGNNKWYIIEIKYQEAFEPPPFKGHGLPRWQINARLDFEEETGIMAMLFIVDKKTNIIYWQYMSELLKGDHFQTKGDKPRLIFPLKSYNILNNG